MVTGAVLTVVAFSIRPVVPEVGVLLEVLPYSCSPHPGTLQDPNNQNQPFSDFFQTATFSRRLRRSLR